MVAARHGEIARPRRTTRRARFDLSRFAVPTDGFEFATTVALDDHQKVDLPSQVTDPPDPLTRRCDHAEIDGRAGLRPKTDQASIAVGHHSFVVEPPLLRERT